MAMYFARRHAEAGRQMVASTQSASTGARDIAATATRISREDLKTGEITEITTGLQAYKARRITCPDVGAAT